MRVSALTGSLARDKGAPRIGDEVRAIDGVPVSKLIEQRAGPNASDGDRKRAVDDLLIRSSGDQRGFAPLTSKVTLDMRRHDGSEYKFTTPWGGQEPPMPGTTPPLAPRNPADKGADLKDCHDVPIGQAAPEGVCTYSYRHPDGYNVGVLRIDSFPGDPRVDASVAKALDRLQTTSGAVVVDLRGNIGGSSGGVASFLAHTLASPTPLLRTNGMNLPDDKKRALDLLETLSDPSAVPAKLRARADRDANAALATLRQGPQEYPLLPTGMSIDEKVDTVMPVKGRNDRPMLVLTGPHTTSSGEILAEMLQGTQRAKVMGEPTPGNVGQLRGFYIPNSFGLGPISTPNTVTLRANGQRMENIGVRPDYLYEPSAGDLAGGYQDYRAAIDARFRELRQ